MALPTIYKGSDEVINITVTDSDNLPILISSCEDVIVSVYQNKETVIQQWKVSDSSLVIVDDSGGIVQANLDRENTSEIPSKRLFIEIVVEITNTNFEGNVQRMIKSDIDLADLKNAVV